MTPQEIDRIECAIRHIQTAVDVDDWARDIAVEAMQKQIPKKVEYTKLKYICKGEEIDINHPECPYCRTHGLTLWDASIPVGSIFCSRCGQAVEFGGD